MRSLLTPAGCPGLPQGANLYSPDGTAYLVAIYTGKVVLANAALAKNDPYFTNPATTIWQSGTSGGPDPLNLLMQEVRTRCTRFGCAALILVLQAMRTQTPSVFLLRASCQSSP